MLHSNIFHHVAIEVLNAELQKQVLANHEDLLSQATWVEKLEGVLSIMQSHVQVHTKFTRVGHGNYIDLYNYKKVLSFRVFYQP